MIDVALQYQQNGLCVLPARLQEKRPALKGWKSFQKRRPNAVQVRNWFGQGTDATALCVVTGTVSGNLEVIDFDHQAEQFNPWVSRIPVELASRLVMERSQSGGRHVIYRCETPVCGNMKLSQVKRKDTVETLIETRGEGGLFLCAPTPGYVLEQGSFLEIPVLSSEEREILLEAAWSLNQHMPVAIDPVGSTREPSQTRPGDDFNERGDLGSLLSRHGWSLVQRGANEYWRRPGKTAGWSATLKDRVFYVFSANAAPFDSNRAYSPFAVYALLDHGGDFEAAARQLRSEGFGSEILHHVPLQVPISSDVFNDEQLPSPVDPGPVPEELLRIPGFISDVMDFCLATAPYPNQVMAFCGALALQSFLAGRKVRDPGDNRTNLYLLGLAHSAAGKDWPRKINTRILHKIGLADGLGERFASGEGIQDALFLSPSMLFQTDEIDGLLQSINKSRDARHENIMTTLLTMYSSANSVFPMRRKAGGESPGTIDQPCLTIFGTAIPNHYYEALSERMLTNGFFARMIILECGRRGDGQEPQIRDLPDSIVNAAQSWSDYRPGTGNLSEWHPLPRIVPQTPRAQQILIDARKQADSEYKHAEAACDAVGTTVWGRVSEQTRKLSLLYAISQSRIDAEIDESAAEWAATFVMHQTRRMLHMAHGHVAANSFHAECLKVIQKLKEAAGRQLSHSVLLKRMKLDSKTFQGIIETLVQQGDVEFVPIKTGGRSGLQYRLPGERS